MLTDLALDSLWSRCLEHLSSKIPESAFHTWFTNLEFLESVSGSLTIGAPNGFVLDYVSHHYRDAIAESASVVMGERITVEFVDLDRGCNNLYTEDAFSEESKISSSQDNEERKTVIDSTFPLNANYNFENFVVGDCNQMAHVACLAVSESPQKNNFNPLTMYGGTGLGKTHLLQAVAQLIGEVETARKVVYRTSEEFTREYITFVHRNKDSRLFYKVYRDVDVLLIDDIQFLADKKSTQEEFFNIFNNLLQLRKQIILTCDRLPSDIKGLHGRLLSRFENGLLASLEPPRLETRLAILRKKLAYHANIQLTEDILGYIAGQFTSNIRELEGTLVKLSAYAHFRHIPVNLDIAREILGDTLRNVNKPVTIRIILDRVSEAFQIPVSHLTSQSRKKEVLIPRQVAMYLARELTDNSLHTIGLSFGRDYSTVIHSLKKIESHMLDAQDLRERVESLKDTISMVRYAP